MTQRTRLVAGPFNRVEGDLEITLDVDDGRVAAAYVNAPLYRGFEQMLIGKDPSDALTLTPRICGICSISQSTAAARAVADAMGITPTDQGLLVQALIHGVENLADHLTHFYLFFMPDFAKAVYRDRPWHGRVLERMAAVDGSAARRAVAMRAELMHIMGLLAGKWPHTLAVQPGGVTKTPDARDRIRILATLRAFRRFLENDVFGGPLEAVTDAGSLQALARGREAGDGDMRLFLEIADDLDLGVMGKGPARFLSFGAYDLADGSAFARGLFTDGAVGPVPLDSIAEHVGMSWMTGEARHPFDGRTQPDADMAEPAYSWCKAPRLAGEPLEVGAIARQLVDGHPLARSLIADGGGRADVRSRVIGRLLEIARTQALLETWAAAIDPNAVFMVKAKRLGSGRGAGLVEAARGALGHWIVARDGRIENYQIIAPTTWNFSPRDDAGRPGAAEAALVGAPVRPDEETPIAVQHIVRSFDPCMVCTVH
jgi:Ni,Fe-hydrogenase I large subunit